MIESEWVERVNPDCLSESPYLEDTFRLKEGAPDDVRKEYEEICIAYNIAG